MSQLRRIRNIADPVYAFDAISKKWITDNSILKISPPLRISNDQIINGPTTPIELIPPTELLNYSGTPSVLPVPVLATLTLDNTSGVYGNISTNSKMLLAWGSDWSATALYSLKINAGTGEQTFQSMNGIFNGQSGGGGYIVAFNGPMIPVEFPIHDNIQDNGLYLVLSNPDGNLSLGHANNYGLVNLYYFLLRL